MASESIKTVKAATGSDAMSPSPRTRQSRVRQKEEAIIAAARDMFISHGYARTTMATIARAAGVADGTLYTYFENKDALARAVISDFYRRLTESAQAGVDGADGLRDKLDFLARHHLDRLMKERGIVEMLPLLTSNIEDYSNSDIYSFNKRYVGVFDRIIREGRAAGEIAPEADVSVLRDVFFGAIDYGAKTLLIRSAPSNFDPLVTQLVSMIAGPEQSGGSLVERMESVADRMETALSRLET